MASVEKIKGKRLHFTLKGFRTDDRLCPNHGFFHRLHQRLETNGQFYKSSKPIHVPPRNQEAIDAVQQALEANPHTSTRAIATDLNMHHVTVHKIIKHSLGWHPFKRHTTHKLIPGDMP